MNVNNNYLKEKIKNLSDNQALSLFNDFSGYLISKSATDGEVLLKHPVLQELPDMDLQELDSRLVPKEQIVPLARQSLQTWAETEGMDRLLEEFMDTYPIKTASAGIVLSMGFIIFSTIVASSLRVTWRDGKLQEVIYDPSKISSKTVDIVKAVMGVFPKQPSG